MHISQPFGSQRLCSQFPEAKFAWIVMTTPEGTVFFSDCWCQNLGWKRWHVLMYPQNPCEMTDFWLGGRQVEEFDYSTVFRSPFDFSLEYGEHVLHRKWRNEAINPSRLKSWNQGCCWTFFWGAYLEPSRRFFHLWSSMLLFSYLVPPWSFECFRYGSSDES